MEATQTTNQAESGLTDVRYLGPSDTQIRIDCGVLKLSHGNESWSNVAVYRAFPVSDPNRYVGFVDSDGQEIGLIREIKELDTESRRILERELELRYFVPIVRCVVDAKEEFGSVYWTVETDRGQAEIVVRNLRDNLHELPGGRV